MQHASRVLITSLRNFSFHSPDDLPGPLKCKSKSKKRKTHGMWLGVLKMLLLFWHHKVKDNSFLNPALMTGISIVCINCNIAHRSWQNFKIKFLWRYGRELCYTLELIQTLHFLNDKEKCMDLYYSFFPGEAKMCLGFFRFRIPPAALTQKN